MKGSCLNSPLLWQIASLTIWSHRGKTLTLLASTLSFF